MWWGRRGLRSRGASLAFSLPPRSEQPLGYHVCSLDPGSLPWWVRAPHRPLPLAPSKVEVEAGTSPRAVLSSQVSVCCCCFQSPRAAREPVSCGFPGPGAGLCPGVARGCGPARRNALRWSPWALAGGWSYKGAKVGTGAPHSYLQPIYSGLPISPSGRGSWGPMGTFFTRCGEGSLHSSTPTTPELPLPPASRAAAAELGVFVEPH